MPAEPSFPLLCYGHSGILVDFPPDPGVTTLFEERQLGRRPYFNHIDAYQIWGWRQESPIPNSPLNQIRLHEFATVPEGKFGQTRVERMRVIYPEKYEVYQRNGEVYGDTSPVGTQDIGLIETGELPFNQIPFVPIYTNRTGMLTSSPPLIDIANLNITHYQRQADLIHALHIAAMPILVMEGWDDAEDSTAVGVNYGMITTPGNKVYYVNADAGAFNAQQEEIKELEMQMSTLGISKLLGQKYVAESADAKRIDQAQANSVLSIISMELESALQQAYYFAARYLGVEPPTISLDRDFDFYRLLGPRHLRNRPTPRRRSPQQRNLPRYSQIRRNYPRQSRSNRRTRPRRKTTRREESLKPNNSLKCNKKRRKTAPLERPTPLTSNDHCCRIQRRPPP